MAVKIILHVWKSRDTLPFEESMFTRLPRVVFFVRTAVNINSIAFNFRERTGLAKSMNITLRNIASHCLKNSRHVAKGRRLDITGQLVGHGGYVTV